MSIQQPLPPPLPPPQHHRNTDPPRSRGEGTELSAAGPCPLCQKGTGVAGTAQAVASCREPGKAGAEPGCNQSGLSASGSSSNAGSPGQAAMPSPISSRWSWGGAGPTAASSPCPAQMESPLWPVLPTPLSLGHSSMALCSTSSVPQLRPEYGPPERNLHYPGTSPQKGASIIPVPRTGPVLPQSNSLYPKLVPVGPLAGPPLLGLSHKQLAGP